MNLEADTVAEAVEECLAVASRDDDVPRGRIDRGERGTCPRRGASGRLGCLGQRVDSTKRGSGPEPSAAASQNVRVVSEQ